MEGALKKNLQASHRQSENNGEAPSNSFFHRNNTIWHRHRSLRDFFGVNKAQSRAQKQLATHKKIQDDERMKENRSWDGMMTSQQPQKLVKNRLRDQNLGRFNNIQQALKAVARSKGLEAAGRQRFEKVKSVKSNGKGVGVRQYDPQAYNWRRSLSGGKEDLSSNSQSLPKLASAEYYAIPATEKQERNTSDVHAGKVKQILIPSRDPRLKSRSKKYYPPKNLSPGLCTQSLLFTFGQYGA